MYRLDVEIVRTERGTFASGQSGNPDGGRAHKPARARILHAVEVRLEHDECAEDAADKLVEGMLDPDGKPVAARLAYERLWPVVSKHEHALPAPPGESEEQWAALAEKAEAEVLGLVEDGTE